MLLRSHRAISLRFLSNHLKITTSRPTKMVHLTTMKQQSVKNVYHKTLPCCRIMTFSFREAHGLALKPILAYFSPSAIVLNVYIKTSFLNSSSASPWITLKFFSSAVDPILPESRSLKDDKNLSNCCEWQCGAVMPSLRLKPWPQTPRGHCLRAWVLKPFSFWTLNLTLYWRHASLLEGSVASDLLLC